jgi:hypothetical protein
VLENPAYGTFKNLNSQKLLAPGPKNRRECYRKGFDMTRIGKLLQFIVLPLISGAVWASPIGVTNADFGVPSILCSGGYAYQATGGDCFGPLVPQQDFNGTPGIGWTFAGSGLTGSGTAFNPPDFSGYTFNQAAFLQGAGSSVSQSITGPAGEWTLSFYLGSRYNNTTDGNQTVDVNVDGLVVGTFALSTGTPFTLEALSFAATSGPHELEFLGTASGDHTAFVSGVSASVVPEPESFALIGVGLLGFGLLRRNRRRG